METKYSLQSLLRKPSFNFLASLINGNFFFFYDAKLACFSFNFLASLINGNSSWEGLASKNL